MNQKVLYLVHAAVIAALYVVLTYAARLLGLDSGVIQVRFSEALTILPFFTPAAIPGIFAGCLLSNLLLGNLPLDVIFGSLASLLGAIGTYVLSRPWKAHINPAGSSIRRWLAPIPPIAANTLIIPFILAYVYKFEGSIPYFMLTVGVGEVISCGILGMLLLTVLQKYRKYIFPETSYKSH